MINLNVVTAAELNEVSQLKGHGFEIVRYRDERGRFDEIRQLEEVPGLAGKWDGAEATDLRRSPCARVDPHVAARDTRSPPQLLPSVNVGEVAAFSGSDQRFARLEVVVNGLAAFALTRDLADIASVAGPVHWVPVRSETAKLPKGQSYPLRPSILEAALRDAGISIDTHLIRSPSELFDAHFWPPNQNVAYERLYVRFGSVPSAGLAQVRSQVETEALPTLLRWIAHILAQAHNSPVRREKQSIDLGSLCH